MNELLIYGPIDGWSVSPETIKAQLDQYPKDEKILVRINSAGGSVLDGIAIYNLLKMRGVDTIVDGIAASIASIIYLAGQERTMSEGSVLMIHNPWTFAGGEAEDLRKEAEILDKLKGSLVDIYTASSGLAESDIITMMDNETWLNASEALEKGFATNKTDSKPAQVAKFDLTRFKNCPSYYKNQTTEADKVTEEEHKAALDQALADQKAQFEKDIEALKAKFEEDQKAEEDRQNSIRALADKSQGELADKLIREKVALVDAQAQLLTDLKARLQNPAPASAEGANLEAFRNSAPAPASTEGSETPRDYRAEFAAIKDPRERAQFFNKHKNQLKGA